MDVTLVFPGGIDPRSGVTDARLGKTRITDEARTVILSDRETLDRASGVEPRRKEPGWLFVVAQFALATS
jgi:hypothetical protein